MSKSFVISLVMIAVTLFIGLESQPARAEYQIATIAMSGDIAPGSGGSGADVSFDFDTFSGVLDVLNTAGEVAFNASTSVNVDGDQFGLFSTAGGSLHAVAFGGQIAPGSGGSGADVPFFYVGTQTLNAAGEVAFYAITSANADGGDHGVFSTAGGTLHTVAFEGQIAPGSGGSGADVPFFFLGAPTLSAAGEVAFYARTSMNADGGERGIFSTAGGTLHAVVFEGQIAPGSGGSGADAPFTSFGGHAINNAGEVAFSGVTAVNADGNDRGIFSTVGGALNAVVFQGDQLEVSPGDFRTVEGFPIATIGFLNFSSFNEFGQILFQANFTDGSTGIFLATPVPEPTAAALVLAATLFIVRRRRGR